MAEPTVAKLAVAADGKLGITFHFKKKKNLRLPGSTMFHERLSPDIDSDQLFRRLDNLEFVEKKHSRLFWIRLLFKNI